MNPKYKVIWTDVAENDLLNIIEYIAEENLTNAKNVFSKIKGKVIDINTGVPTLLFESPITS
jgi:plasmid stabilization system protein ParE